MSPASRPPFDCWWELTRACAGQCLHCRSSSGRAVPGELSQDEALRVADELAALAAAGAPSGSGGGTLDVPSQMGLGLVVLTGGEPFLFEGWERVAARLAAAGVTVRLAISGLGFDGDVLARALGSGVSSFAVSLDGPRHLHDRLRPAPPESSSWQRAVDVITTLVRAGHDVRVVTSVGRANMDALEETYRLVRDLGVPRWQVQLIQPLGRARANALDTLVSPAVSERIVQVLLRAAREGRVLAPLHCSVGYLMPEDALLRGRGGGPPVWTGTQAGISGFAITATGRVTGCACLPDEFAVAEVRTRTLQSIWSDDASFPYTRAWDPGVLAGACASCAFARTCRAGCLGVAWGSTGTIGANPTCLTAK